MKQKRLYKMIKINKNIYMHGDDTSKQEAQRSPRYQIRPSDNEESEKICIALLKQKEV